MHYSPWWCGLGSIMLLGVTVLSLIPMSPDLPMAGADKLQHALAYGTLMYWWGMVQPDRQLRWMAGLLALGAALELAQGLTAYRDMEAADLAADFVGLLAALCLLRTSAARLLVKLDLQLFNRLNAGSP